MTTDDEEHGAPAEQGSVPELEGELPLTTPAGEPLQDEESADEPSDDSGDDITVEVGEALSGNRNKVVAMRDGEVLYVDSFSLASKRSRKTFIDSLSVLAPGLGDEQLAEIEASLMQQGAAPSTRMGASQAPAVPKSVDELVAKRDERAQAALEAMDPEVVAAAEDLLLSPELIPRIQRSLEMVGVVGEETLRLALYLVGTSRLLASPLSGIVFGPSSAGKSHVIAKVADLFPYESVLRATDMTPNALYYLEEEALVHRFVVAGERARREDDEQAEATRALREMLSEKVLRKVIPVKTGDGGFTTTPIVRHGPIAFVESTTLTRVFDEDSNRALTLVVDESAEQTRRVMNHMALVAGQGSRDVRRIIDTHHALQRLLRRVKVIVPFAVQVSDHIPADRPEARRASAQVWSVVQAVAALHQRQRCGPGVAVEHGAVIVASLEDYGIAREVLVESLGRALGSDITPAIRRFGERVIAQYPEGEFTAVDASKRDKTIKNPQVARRYLAVLVEAGVVELLEQGRGGKPNRYKVIGQIPQAGAALLPTVEELLAAGVEATTAGQDTVRLVASSEDVDETTSAASFSEDRAQPTPAVRLGAPGRQPPPADDEDESWRTKRTEADQEPRLPDAGSSASPVPEDSADDQTHQGELIEGGAAEVDWDEQDFGFMGALEEKP